MAGPRSRAGRAARSRHDVPAPSTITYHQCLGKEVAFQTRAARIYRLCQRSAHRPGAAPVVASALDPLVRADPDFEAAAAVVRALATALPETTLPEGVPHIDAARARLAAGIPALEGEPLVTGWTLLANARVLADALAAADVEQRGVPNALERTLSQDESDALAAAAQAGSWDLISEMAARLGLEPDVVVTLLDHAARPALRAGTKALLAAIAESRWSRGTCPACGAAPLLSELRSDRASGAEQERVLRCGRCLAAWSYQRLRCVSCGETNHKQLGYLHGPGQSAFRRADICSTCHCYIKSVTALAQLTHGELLSIDLATAALDLGAIEHGFHR